METKQTHSYIYTKVVDEYTLDEYALYNFIVLAILVPKIIKVGTNVTTF